MKPGASHVSVGWTPNGGKSNQAQTAIFQWGVQSAARVFPAYTTSEWRLDVGVHVVGMVGAVVASIWLLSNAADKATFSLSVYSAGLIAMLWTSALYNLLPHISLKEIARRLDHAVIFVMIAGTYTPFTVDRLPGRTGLWVGVFVWLAAAVGIGLTLMYPHRYQWLRLGMYLMSGWAIALVIGPLSSSVNKETLTLLLAGGVVYSVGAVFHLLNGIRFHNAIWHVFVLAAVSLHFAAMTTEFVA